MVKLPDDWDAFIDVVEGNEAPVSCKMINGHPRPSFERIPPKVHRSTCYRSLPYFDRMSKSLERSGFGWPIFARQRSHPAVVWNSTKGEATPVKA